MTENPATESVDDRDGVPGAPGYQSAQYAQPVSQEPPTQQIGVPDGQVPAAQPFLSPQPGYPGQPAPPFLAQAAPPRPYSAQQPYRAQPPAPVPPAYVQPVPVPPPYVQPAPVPPAYSQPAPVPPAYVQPVAAVHPQPVHPQPAYAQPAYAQPAYAPSPQGVPRGNVGGPTGMLASAADRERAIDVCKASYGEGRLTKDEFDARVHQITTSRTYGDLAVVISDLPAGPLGGVSHYQAGGFPVPAPNYPSPVRPTNGMAIGSLICALLAISLPAVIMGHIARGQVRERNEAGEGLAAAGLVIGYIGTAFWVLLFILIVGVTHGGG